MLFGLFSFSKDKQYKYTTGNKVIIMTCRFFCSFVGVVEGRLKVMIGVVVLVVTNNSMVKEK